MATNVEEKIDGNVDTEGMSTTPPTDAQNDTSDTGNVQIGHSCRTKLVNLGKILLHLVCLGYSFYLIWLLAYLKDTNYYWLLSYVPIFSNFVPFLLLCKAYRNNDFSVIRERGSIMSMFKVLQPSYGVVPILMASFTMLTRQAYYHRQLDEFIGPRFIILSLQASIIVILMDFVLERARNQENLLDYKDALSRMLLDFADIFNMVEILSVNVCVGVGSFVSEESSTEKAVQAFCKMSFVILLPFAQPNTMVTVSEDEEGQHSPRTAGEILNSKMTIFSGFYQNFPFLIIRIVVWVQYDLYSLTFLLKNVYVIVLFLATLHKYGLAAFTLK